MAIACQEATVYSTHDVTLREFLDGTTSGSESLDLRRRRGRRERAHVLVAAESLLLRAREV
jgi:hypothetical protein